MGTGTQHRETFIADQRHRQFILKSIGNLIAVILLNKEPFKMSIFLIFDFYRGNKTTPGSNSVRWSIKRKRDKSNVSVCLIPFSRSSLNLGKKMLRLHTTVAMVFNSENGANLPYGHYAHERVSDSLLPASRCEADGHC